jgi:hypothetical protein
MIIVNGENLEKENQSDCLLLALHNNFQWRKLGKRFNPSASSSCSSISSTLTCVHVVTFMIQFPLCLAPSNSPLQFPGFSDLICFYAQF